jgi:hypothetical protein
MEFKRKIATIEEITEQIYDLKVSFRISDEFATVMANRVLKQQLTLNEIRWAVDYLVENHNGNLFVADVMELCRMAKRNRLPEEYLEKIYLAGRLPDDIEIICSETHGNGSNFDSNGGSGVITLPTQKNG